MCLRPASSTRRSSCGSRRRDRAAGVAARPPRRSSTIGDTSPVGLADLGDLVNPPPKSPSERSALTEPTTSSPSARPTSASPTDPGQRPGRVQPPILVRPPAPRAVPRLVRFGRSQGRRRPSRETRPGTRPGSCRGRAPPPVQERRVDGRVHLGSGGVLGFGALELAAHTWRGRGARRTGRFAHRASRPRPRELGLRIETLLTFPWVAEPGASRGHES
jgi:hypothetical protein